MPQIWIRIDAAGVHPVMTNEQDELPCAGDVDWHFVAVIDDRQEGERLMELLRQEHEHRLSDAHMSLQVSADPDPLAG